MLSCRNDDMIQVPRFYMYLVLRVVLNIYVCLGVSRWDD
jgi:hypothetical protein